MNWSIYGHEWAADLLGNHITHDAVRHAYLFCGPPGIGRRTLALKFVQALNCLQPPSPGEACGSCRMCQQTAREQQPDLHIIRIEEDASNIKVEQIRDLQRVLALSPYQARYRVALLLGFEKATPGAQNALLKTLEEAPEKAILLLTADSPDNLLPTIVSRCELLRLRPWGWKNWLAHCTLNGNFPCNRQIFSPTWQAAVREWRWHWMAMTRPGPTEPPGWNICTPP